MLLARGAPRLPHGRDTEGATALHRAAEAGHTQVCATLLDFGARVGAKNARGVTALQMAAARGHVDICKLLRDRDIAKREAKAAKKANREPATEITTDGPDDGTSTPPPVADGTSTPPHEP